jgi:hypothetical protein
LKEATMTTVESDLLGCGYCRIERKGRGGTSDRLEITIEDGVTGDGVKTLTIAGSIEIEEFFALIDQIQAQAKP